MDTSERRRGPLSLRIEDDDVTLLAGEAQDLIAAIGAWRDSLRKQLDQLARDKPQNLQAMVRSIGRLEQLANRFATAPAGIAAPPLELDADQLQLLRDVLGELSGYQRRELSPGMAELKRALAKI